MLQRLKQSMQRFMYGRYGSDQLNIALLLTALVLSLLSSVLSLFFRDSALVIHSVLTLLIYALLGVFIFRALSRNTYRRQRENQRFKYFKLRLTDRNNRYFRCPECHQTMRVPRDRGKVSIRCPKCGEKFTRKT